MGRGSRETYFRKVKLFDFCCILLQFILFSLQRLTVNPLRMFFQRLVSVIRTRSHCYLSLKMQLFDNIAYLVMSLLRVHIDFVRIAYILTL